MKTDDQNQNHKKNKISFKSIFDAIRDEISKIASFKIKENKALNQTEFIIRGENKMPEGIVKKGKTKKEPKLHPEIKQFMEEQRKFNQSQNEKWEEQSKVNHTILTSIQQILLKLKNVQLLKKNWMNWNNWNQHNKMRTLHRLGHKNGTLQKFKECFLKDFKSLFKF